jgi:hypothetical protein
MKRVVGIRRTLLFPIRARYFSNPSFDADVDFYKVLRVAKSAN